MRISTLAHNSLAITFHSAPFAPLGKSALQFKGVIQSKKIFDMCYQTLGELQRHQQN
jgi:hypothetical protein